MLYNVRNIPNLMSKSTTDKIDWIIHNVYDDKSFKKNRMDNHSHGLTKFFDKELQITIAIQPKLAGYIINTLGLLGVMGYKLKDGDTVIGLFEDENMKVDLKDNTDTYDRPILRIILPEENNKTTDSTVYPYSEQDTNPYL